MIVIILIAIKNSEQELYPMSSYNTIHSPI